MQSERDAADEARHRTQRQFDLLRANLDEMSTLVADARARDAAHAVEIEQSNAERTRFQTAVQRLQERYATLRDQYQAQAAQLGYALPWSDGGHSWASKHSQYIPIIMYFAAPRKAN